jgi:hypothetical protein
MASLNITFRDKSSLTPVTRCTTDNLPAHVKGSAEWNTVAGHTRYYIPERFF